MAEDGRNDWPFNSNGAYVRKYWLIATDDPVALRTFAAEIKDPQSDKFAADLVEVNEPPGNWTDELTGFSRASTRLFILRLSYGRGPMLGELPD